MKLLAIVAAICALSQTAIAQTGECKLITDATARLACYDKAAPRAATDKPAIARPIAAVPAMWAALHVVRSLGSYPGGWLSDRLGPRPTMVAGWAAYAAVCAGLAVADSVVQAGCWFLAFGIVAVLTEAPERAFIAARGGERRGTKFGVYHAAVGFGALPGGLVFGLLYANAGGAAALMTSAGLAGLLVVAGLLWRK